MIDPQGEVCLTLDGRIDNRAELRADLGTHRGASRDGSDAELLLAAYLRWGRAASAGSSASSRWRLWDGRQPTSSLLARDFLGKRPLLYHRGPRRPAVGLRAAGRARRPAVAAPAERGAWSGERLSLVPQEHARRRCSRTSTASRRRTCSSSRAAACGSSATGTGDRVPVRLGAAMPTTWPSCSTPSTRPSLARLDAPGPVAAELSGGRRLVVGRRHRPTTSCEPGGPARRSSCSALVFPGEPTTRRARPGWSPTHLGPPRGRAAAGAPRAPTTTSGRSTTTCDLPEPPNMAMHRPLHALAREQGARVLARRARAATSGSPGAPWCSPTPSGARACPAGSGAPPAPGARRVGRPGLAPPAPAQTGSGRCCPPGCSAVATARERLPPGSRSASGVRSGWRSASARPASAARAWPGRRRPVAGRRGAPLHRPSRASARSPGPASRPGARSTTAAVVELALALPEERPPPRGMPASGCSGPRWPGPGPRRGPPPGRQGQLDRASSTSEHGRPRGRHAVPGPRARGSRLGRVGTAHREALWTALRSRPPTPARATPMHGPCGRSSRRNGGSALCSDPISTGWVLTTKGRR